jgi:hypothetical protein
MKTRARKKGKSASLEYVKRRALWCRLHARCPARQVSYEPTQLLGSAAKLFISQNLRQIDIGQIYSRAR